MSTCNENKRQQLIDKLKEMFQVDQADLDFGIQAQWRRCHPGVC